LHQNERANYDLLSVVSDILQLFSTLIIRPRTPAAVSGYHPSSAKLAFWTQYIIARLL